MKIYCIRQRLFEAQYVEIELWDIYSLKRHLLWIVSTFFDSHKSLLCSKRINGIAGFSKIGRQPILPKQQLSCRTSFVMVLPDVGFGCHDSQTSCQLTSFCGDFVKSLQQKPKKPGGLQYDTEQAVAGIDEVFEKLQRKLCKG